MYTYIITATVLHTTQWPASLALGVQRNVAGKEKPTAPVDQTSPHMAFALAVTAASDPHWSTGSSFPQGTGSCAAAHLCHIPGRQKATAACKQGSA